MAVWLRLKSGDNYPGDARRRAEKCVAASADCAASVSTPVLAKVRLEVSEADCLDGCAGKRTVGGGQSRLS